MEFVRQVFDGAIGDQLAFVDDQNAVANGGDLLQDVGGEDDGLLAAQLLDEVSDLDDLVRIEAAGGLVEDEHFGRMQDRLGQPNPLLVALREVLDVAVQDVSNAALVGDLFDACAPLGARNPADLRDEV